MGLEKQERQRTPQQKVEPSILLSAKLLEICFDAEKAAPSFFNHFLTPKKPLKH